jgi:hypothetical protein
LLQGLEVSTFCSVLFRQRVVKHRTDPADRETENETFDIEARPLRQLEEARRVPVLVVFAHQSFARRSLSALVTTDTELIAMAAPAKIGDSSSPKKG